MAQAALQDVHLLKCASLFLVARCGLPTGLSQLEHGIGPLCAENVSAYDRTGRYAVADRVRKLAGTFPRTIVSIVANANGRFARVDYGLEMELLSFAPAPATNTDIPCALERVATYGADPRATPKVQDSSIAEPSGVQLLWWAIRFLMADLGHNYDAQLRWLTNNAAAFGEIGREAVVKANRATAETGVTYGVPYPMTVDDVYRKVTLPFDAFKNGDLVYRGIDIYELDAESDPPGQVSRIITVNHAGGTCYSPQNCVGSQCGHGQLLLE